MQALFFFIYLFYFFIFYRAKNMIVKQKLNYKSANIATFKLNIWKLLLEFCFIFWRWHILMI